MNINYDQLSEIKKELNEYPEAKLQIVTKNREEKVVRELICLLYTSPSPRDLSTSRMPSSA